MAPCLLWRWLISLLFISLFLPLLLSPPPSSFFSFFLLYHGFKHIHWDSVCCNSYSCWSSHYPVFGHEESLQVGSWVFLTSLKQLLICFFYCLIKLDDIPRTSWKLTVSTMNYFHEVWFLSLDSSISKLWSGFIGCSLLLLGLCF